MGVSDLSAVAPEPTREALAAQLTAIQALMEQVSRQASNTAPPGYYDQYEVTVTAVNYSVHMERHFDVVEAVYADPQHAGRTFTLLHNNFALDSVEAEKDGRLRFFGGRNMNFPVHACADITIDTQLATGLNATYRIIGYRLPPRECCDTQEGVLPVISCGRRNLLRINVAGVHGDMRLAYEVTGHGRNPNRVVLEEAVYARMHPLPKLSD